MSWFDTDKATVVNCKILEERRGYRRTLYHIVQTPQFKNILQGVVFLNVILTISTLAITSDDHATVEAYSVIFAILNAGFALIYTGEALMKVIVSFRDRV